MGVLDLVILLLVISWLGGFAFNLAGDVIHVLLVIAVVMFVMRFLRRAV